jgi:hypothetical protein
VGDDEFREGSFRFLFSSKDLRVVPPRDLAEEDVANRYRVSPQADSTLPVVNNRDPPIAVDVEDGPGSWQAAIFIGASAAEVDGPRRDLLDPAPEPNDWC